MANPLLDNKNKNLDDAFLEAQEVQDPRSLGGTAVGQGLAKAQVGSGRLANMGSRTKLNIPKGRGLRTPVTKVPGVLQGEVLPSSTAPLRMTPDRTLTAGRSGSAVAKRAAPRSAPVAQKLLGAGQKAAPALSRYARGLATLKRLGLGAATAEAVLLPFKSGADSIPGMEGSRLQEMQSGNFKELGQGSGLGLGSLYEVLEAANQGLTGYAPTDPEHPFLDSKPFRALGSMIEGGKGIWNLPGNIVDDIIEGNFDTSGVGSFLGSVADTIIPDFGVTGRGLTAGRTQDFKPQQGNFREGQEQQGMVDERAPGIEAGAQEAILRNELDASGEEGALDAARRAGSLNVNGEAINRVREAMVEAGLPQDASREQILEVMANIAEQRDLPEEVQINAESPFSLGSQMQVDPNAEFNDYDKTPANVKAFKERVARERADAVARFGEEAATLAFGAKPLPARTGINRAEEQVDLGIASAKKGLEPLKPGEFRVATVDPKTGLPTKVAAGQAGDAKKGIQGVSKRRQKELTSGKGLQGKARQVALRGAKTLNVSDFNKTGKGSPKLMNVRMPSGALITGDRLQKMTPEKRQAFLAEAKKHGGVAESRFKETEKKAKTRNAKGLGSAVSSRAAGEKRVKDSLSRDEKLTLIRANANSRDTATLRKAAAIRARIKAGGDAGAKDAQAASKGITNRGIAAKGSQLEHDRAIELANAGKSEADKTPPAEKPTVAQQERSAYQSDAVKASEGSVELLKKYMDYYDGQVSSRKTKTPKPKGAPEIEKIDLREKKPAKQKAGIDAKKKKPKKSSVAERASSFAGGALGGPAGMIFGKKKKKKTNK